MSAIRINAAALITILSTALPALAQPPADGFRLREARISETASNHLVGVDVIFRWQSPDNVFTAPLPAAADQRPAARTQQWNTFFGVDQDLGSVKIKAKNPDFDATFTAMRWRAPRTPEDKRKRQGVTLKAEIGANEVVQIQCSSTVTEEPERLMKEAVLWGKFLEGDNKAKPLVTFMSTVRHDAGGHRYEYRVRNDAKQTLHFAWAGFKEAVKPGKQFAKEFRSANSPEEATTSARFQFGDGPEHVITAHHWNRP